VNSRFIWLSSCFVKQFRHRVPRETADRVQDFVGTGPSDIYRSGGASLVLSGSGSIRRCVYPLYPPATGEGVDAGHPNREIAAYVSPKQECALKYLRGYGSEESCELPPLTFFAPFHVGYLMRLAYELGFANATLFCRRPVRFLSLDKIAFTKPVSIGGILRLRSTVIHSTASEKYPAIVVSSPSVFVSVRLNPSCSYIACSRRSQCRGRVNGIGRDDQRLPIHLDLGRWSPVIQKRGPKDI